MLKVDHVTLFNEIEQRTYIQDLSFTLNAGDKLALIGEEGNGKTTLLKVLLGEKVEHIVVHGNIVCEGTCGYLEQDCKLRFGNEDTLSFLLKKNPDSEIAMEDYALLKNVDALLSRLNLSKEAFDYGKKLSDYSGGEAVKLALLKLLLKEPSMLFLDEPTNDLDFETILFLSDFLKQTKQPLIFVSHDENLLAEIATGIIDLQRTQRKKEALSFFSGLPYLDYRSQRMLSLEREMSLATKQRETLQKKEKRFRRIYQNTQNELEQTNSRNPSQGRLLKKHIHVLKSQGKRLEKERESMIDFPEITEAIKIFFNFQKEFDSGKVISIDIPELKIKDRLLATGIHLELKGNQHIGIIGKNGVGKTTFLRQARDILSSREGLKVAYFPQDYAEVLDEKKSALENLASDAGQQTRTEFRLLLGRLLFTSEEMLYPINHLSGGEKGKVLLARLVVEGANVLLLDEPTRNFSPLSQGQLLAFFQAFKGPIILVSHDRFFLKTLTDVCYDLKNDGFHKLP